MIRFDSAASDFRSFFRSSLTISLMLPSDQEEQQEMILGTTKVQKVTRRNSSMMEENCVNVENAWELVALAKMVSDQL